MRPLESVTTLESNDLAHLLIGKKFIQFRHHASVRQPDRVSGMGTRDKVVSPKSKRLCECELVLGYKCSKCVLAVGQQVQGDSLGHEVAAEKGFDWVFGTIHCLPQAECHLVVCEGWSNASERREVPRSDGMPTNVLWGGSCGSCEKTPHSGMTPRRDTLASCRYVNAKN